jgi:hypothetical protein
VCCNPSCGICAKPGESCSTEPCARPPVGTTPYGTIPQ